MCRIKDTKEYRPVVNGVLMLLIVIGLPSAARADAVTDWNAFGVKEFKLMKHALFILLTGPPFFPNDTQREVFAFLADN